MLNALTNVCFWGQSRHGSIAAYQSRFMSTRPFNPFDPFETILLLSMRSPIPFGYAKPVPVNFRALHNQRRDSIFVA
jgi:hypothetical protein